MGVQKEYKDYKIVRHSWWKFWQVIMEEPKRKINWLQVALDVLKVVLGALVGTQL